MINLRQVITFLGHGALMKRCSDQKEFSVLFAIYLGMYLMYRYAVRIHFDAGPVDYFMQFADAKLLKNDLFWTLWYLHSQPPLLNFVAGLALKTGSADMVLAVVYFALGAAALWCLEQSFCMMGVRPLLRVGVCAWLCIFPTFILYANWAYASHVEFSFCCMVLYFLLRVFNQERLSFKGGFSLFFCCTMLALTRGQWHPVFFVFMLAMILWFRRDVAGKRSFVTGSSIALLPVLLLFIKNFIVFGFFGASSWMGMNLAEVASEIMPTAELEIMRQHGDISPYFPVRFKPDIAEKVREDFKKNDRYITQQQHESLEIKKSNGIENYNYIAFIEGSKQDLADSLVVIKHAPMAYVNEVSQRIYNTAHWASLPYEHRKMMEGYEYIIGQGCKLLYIIAPALALALGLFPDVYPSRHRPVILIGFFLILVMVITSSAFTYGGESPRMRWGSAPLYLMCLAICLECVARIPEEKAV